MTSINYVIRSRSKSTSTTNKNAHQQSPNSKSTDGSNQILTAVALQDHWTRTLSLGSNIGPHRVGLGPAARAKQKPAARSVIDTGLHRGKKKTVKTEDTQREYVLDEKPPPLTLAQKYGLVHAPDPLLSEQEWTKVKSKSNQRDDSGEPCVICKEDFGIQEQVLLSCTHVFHRACLQAFERFTGKKTCPMCRHEQYQTRVIHEGARLHRHKCATRIQSLWRGHVVRCWYIKLRETVPPKDPKLRKKFYEDKMSSIIDRMIKSLDVNVNQFLQEIESNVRQSRAVFNQWDATQTSIKPHEWEDIQLKAVMRGVTDCPICLTELHLSDTDANADLDKEDQYDDLDTKAQSGNYQQTRKHKDKSLLEKLGPDSSKNSDKLTDLPTFDGKVKAKTSKRHKVFTTEIPNEDEDLTKKQSRETALLSCSHVFHATCLQTLEEMAMIDMKHSCPVCRAHYQKKIISL